MSRVWAGPAGWCRPESSPAAVEGCDSLAHASSLLQYTGQTGFTVNRFHLFSCDCGQFCLALPDLMFEHCSSVFATLYPASHLVHRAWQGEEDPADTPSAALCAPTLKRDHALWPGDGRDLRH